MKENKLKVNEIFYSIQGEGANAGMPAVFVRLAGCNLNCPFCDTEYESYTEMSIAEIKSEVVKYNCRNIIWTGGEPTLQLGNNTLKYFREFYNCIESNGTKLAPSKIDYITISPKVLYPKHYISGYHIDELRYPIANGDELPDINRLPQANRYYLSPIDVSKENVDYCLKLIKENPQWRLSVQIHKLLNIR
jgi:organic radical activating enzyme